MRQRGDIMNNLNIIFLPIIELFARQKVDGWDCWGDEV